MVEKLKTGVNFENTLVENHKTGAKYKFLGVRESVMQDDKQALTVAADALAKVLNNLDKPSLRR